MIGKTLGHYRIESQVGHGGMGVVYRAVDTQLKRAVAIKVLRPETVADADRKARFVQEARAASALNHPSIVTIYHIGTDAATDFIAMELVAGRSLDEILRGRRLLLADAVRYALQIADALAAAHHAGIVHRDLKPGNVMVTDAGQIKLLDFGLAKLTDRTEGSDSTPTASTGPETAVGMVVGTAAYMSPEQATGTTVDARSDIFSFGVVLYEMITGRRPMPAISPEPIPELPRDVQRVISRCLQQDPRRRFQSMDDARMALEDAELDARPPAIPARSHRRTLGLAAGVALFAAALGAAAVWALTGVAPSNDRLLTRLTMDSGVTGDQALSPDGRLMAYASDRAGEGNLDIWVQQIAGGDPVRLTRDGADDIEPSFSPDGSQVVFRSNRDGGGIYVVSTLGGDSRRIVDRGRRPRWSPDGRSIAYWAGLDTAFLMSKVDAPRAYVISATGGEPRQIAPDFAVAWAPVWSADGLRLLFLGSHDSQSSPDWWVVPAGGGAPVPTGAPEMAARQGLRPSPESFFKPEVWTGDGQVLFSAQLGDSTNIWQIRIGPAGTAGGRAERLTAGTGLEVKPSVGAGNKLIFSVLTNNLDLWSLPVDTSSGQRTGQMERLTQDPATDAYPWFSPDGRKLVYVSNRMGSYSLWLREMATAKEAIIAAQVAFPGIPFIAKDGSLVYFESGTPRRLFSLPLSGVSAMPSSAVALVCDDCHGIWELSADGKWSLTPKNDDAAIFARELATGKTTEFIQAPGEIVGRLRISPDDRWVAFSHRAGGALHLNVVPFRPGAPIAREQWIPFTPSEAQTNASVWSRDSRLLYFLSSADGQICIWARHVDRETGRPAADAFPVWHFHDTRRSMSRIPFGNRALALAADRIVVTLSESTGNIWMSTTAPTTQVTAR